MATTLAKKYIDKINEVYKNGLLTAPLELNSTYMREGINAKDVLIPEYSMTGMGNYNRATGYVNGEVSLSWRSYTFRYDRGRSFSIDNADNMETANVSFGMLAGEFTRTQVIPEIDATRFSEMYKGAGTKVTTVTLTAANIVSEIKKAQGVMNEAEVPAEGRILYMSFAAKSLLEASSEYTKFKSLDLTTDVQTGVQKFDGMQIVGVPQSRFYTAITLYDGTTSGQTAGGYVNSGKNINFMIVHPSAVTAMSKIDNVRVFDKAENQLADAYKYDYRRYHDLWVLKMKEAGVYAVSTPAV